MKTKLSRKTSILLLSIIALFERGSYYGMSAILILFAISESGLNLNREIALSYYDIFALLIVLLPLPLGILTDFTIKQTKAVFIGGMIALLGYALLMTNQFYLIGIGLLIIAIGTSFVRPNLSILIGRLFDKSDGRRDLGFIIFYMGINIGSFLFTITIGYVGEVYSWIGGFALAALSSLIYLSIFYFTKDKLNLVESNTHQIANEIETQNIAENRVKFNYFNTNMLILFITILSVIFWTYWEHGENILVDRILMAENLMIWNNELADSLAYSLSAFFGMFMMLIFFVIWYFRGIGSTLFKIACSFLVLGLTFGLTAFIYIIPENSLLFCLIPLFSILAIAEILIDPIALSYITRLSNIKYSSTIYALFVLISYFGAKAFNLIINAFDSSFLMMSPILIICIGIGLLLGRKKLVAASGGID